MKQYHWGSGWSHCFHSDRPTRYRDCANSDERKSDITTRYGFLKDKLSQPF